MAVIEMKRLFKNIPIIEFEDLFSSNEKCLEFLADKKWVDGFLCRKCGNTNYCKGKTPFARRCTKCKSEESATAHTIFHRCKVNLTDAFRITYLVCHTPQISTYKLSEELNIRQMTCWKFKHKIMECIEQRGDLDILQQVEPKAKISKER